MNSSWNTLSTIVLLALHNSKIDETSKLWWSLSIVTEDFENNESAMKIQGKCVLNHLRLMTCLLKYWKIQFLSTQKSLLTFLINFWLTASFLKHWKEKMLPRF